MSKDIPNLTAPISELPKKVERISPAEEEVFSKLIPKFQELRINVDEFVKVSESGGGYSREEIERDKESVQRKKKKIEDQDTAPTKRAQILEALMAEQIELSEWLGPDAMTIIPAEYDDLYNGVDLATEFQGADSLQHLAMGVDVTSSPTPIEKKLTAIRDHLMDGSLTQMKYFTSEGLPDFHGRMSNIPQIVIGTDARTINELAQLWLTIEHSKKPEAGTSSIDRDALREKAREAQQKLAHHRIQVLILKQMQAQLETFQTYTKKNSQPNVSSKLASILKLIDDILKEKRISKIDEQLNEQDDVFRSIKINLEKLF